MEGRLTENFRKADSLELAFLFTFIHQYVSTSSHNGSFIDITQYLCYFSKIVVL